MCNCLVLSEEYRFLVAFRDKFGGRGKKAHSSWSLLARQHFTLIKRCSPHVRGRERAHQGERCAWLPSTCRRCLFPIGWGLTSQSFKTVYTSENQHRENEGEWTGVSHLSSEEVTEPLCKQGFTRFGVSVWEGLKYLHKSLTRQGR